MTLRKTLFSILIRKETSNRSLDVLSNRLCRIYVVTESDVSVVSFLKVNNFLKYTTVFSDTTVKFIRKDRIKSWTILLNRPCKSVWQLKQMTISIHFWSIRISDAKTDLSSSLWCLSVVSIRDLKRYPTSRSSESSCLSSRHWYLFTTYRYLVVSFHSIHLSGSWRITIIDVVVTLSMWVQVYKIKF